MIPRPATSFTRPSRLLLLAGALTLPSVHAAATKQEAAPAAAEFKELSGSYPRECSAPVSASLAPLGQPSVRQCAWSGHVEMLYWASVPAPAAGCLTPAALAWHQLARSVTTAIPPWNNAAAGQALLTNPGTAGMQQAAAVWRQPDGQWSAVLWRWEPSSRAATRAWQAGHWNDVANAVRALDAGKLAAPSALLQAWLASSKDKPRLLDGGTWRWLADGACLNLQTAVNAQARLHLPHSRDDARQEQRSAMQVQLARRFPNAEWLQPFTLLEPGVPGARTGAKFVAVWKEANAVQGRLWIPLPKDGGIVRAHVTTAAPVGNSERAQEITKQRAALIERELSALAHAWEASHE
ncbi:hypothetical protein [Massilia sp. AB1]|uniref:hypothetical protein n=1 Tax=Massilia sp. AB1 TaxID=2823371 RepID=UPI001B82C3A1|nr:hypothetical protein [Massilia sp. AB1]MBQ5940971.1 hypothetical protein [Massilia sp. AB1]